MAAIDFMEAPQLGPSTTIQTIREFPRPSALTIPTVTVGDYTDVSQTFTASALPPSAPEAMFEGDALGVDMRYVLQEVNMVQTLEHKLGRQWTTARCDVAWARSATWGDDRMILVPAVAGTAAAIPDRNTAAAIAAMPILFCEGGGATEFGATARKTIASLASQSVNSVRFAWRLAALWHGARLAELKGEANVYPDNEVTIRFIGHVRQFATLLAGLGSTDVIPYRVAHSSTAEITNIRILALAAADGWQWNTPNMPSVVRTLPPLTNPEVIIFGPAINVVFGGALSSAQVWQTAVDWCAAFGSTDIFIECIQTIAALLFSPTGQSPFYLHKVLRIALPRAAMAPLALGVMSERYVQWEETAPTLMPPPYKTLVANACAVQLVAGLCIRQVGLLSGLPLYPLFARTGIANSLLHTRQWMARAGGCPVMAAANKMISACGIAGNLGRIIIRCSVPQMDATELYGWWAAHDTAFQWEEALYALEAVPAASAIHGRLQPLRTEKPMVVNRWYGVGAIPQAYHPVAALHALHYVRDVEYADRLVDVGTGAVTIDVRALADNYRGLPSDWTVIPKCALGGHTIEPVLRITTVTAAAQAHYGPQYIGFTKLYMHVVEFEATERLVAYVAGPVDDLGGPRPGKFSDERKRPPTPPASKADDDKTLESSEPTPDASRRASMEDIEEPLDHKQMKERKDGRKKDGHPKPAAIMRAQRATACRGGIALGDVVAKYRDKFTDPTSLLKLGELAVAASAPTATDADAGAKRALVVRQLLDQWVQHPIAATLETIQPAMRTQIARLMGNIGRWCSIEAPSWRDSAHCAITAERWTAAASALNRNPALTLNEMKIELPNISVDLLRPAYAALDKNAQLEAGFTPSQTVARTVQYYNVKTAQMSDKRKLAERHRIFGDSINEKAIERRAQFEREVLAKQEAELRQAYEAQIIDNATIIEVLGIKPSWLVEEKTPEPETKHDPSALFDASSTVHAKDVDQHLEDDQHVDLTTRRQRAEAGAGVIPPEHLGTADFGPSSLTEPLSQPMPPPILPATQHPGTSNNDFEQVNFTDKPPGNSKKQ